MKKIPSVGLFLSRTALTAAMAVVALNAQASYQSTVQGDHPIAYYPLDVSIDTGLTATDLSGNGNDGTYNGAAPIYNNVAGPTTFIPNALQFDGQTAWVDLSTGTNISILNFGGKISMEAWIQSAAPSQNLGDVLAKGYDNNYNSSEMTLRVNGNQYQGGTYNNSVGSRGAGFGPPSGNWDYVVTTYDGTNWNLYVNGTLKNQSGDNTGALNFPTAWAIGNGTANGYGRWFQGSLCQVALYSNALTSAQIYSHYFAGQYGTSPSNSVPIIITQPAPQVSYVGGRATFSVGVLSLLPTTNQWFNGNTPIIGATNSTLILSNVQTAANYSVVVGNSNGTTNSAQASLTLSLPAPSVYESSILNDQPVAYVPLDGSADTATTAYDWSGNGNNGTYNGSSSYNTGNGPAPFISNSANFNGGLSAMLGGPNSGVLDFGGKITLEAWVQPSNVSGNLQNILAKGYDSSTYNETVLRQDSGTFTGNGGSGGTAQVGAWTYVVSANDGTNWNLYVNGTLVKRSTSSSGATSFTDPWAIGSGSSGGSGRYFNGNLSQVALYNYGLSPAQVMAHYLIAEAGATNVRPVISSQPAAQAGFTGGTATFTVAVISLTPVTNQWFLNGNPLNGQTNASLVLNNLSAGDIGNYSVVVGNMYGTTNSASAALTVTVPNSLTWSASNNNGIWDTGTSANWINNSTSSQTVFSAGDAVTFDDTAGVPTTVTIGGTVQPSLITVNSSDNNFTLQRAGDGSGSISGSGNLIKKGSSTLTVVSGGGLTGSALIAGGLVYAGNNSFANFASIAITNNSTMDIGGGSFNSGKPVTISDSGLNGQGTIINTYGDYPTAAFNIKLAADATITGGPQRWDLVSGSVSGAHVLTVNGVGSYSMEWNSVTISSNVSSIVFTNGEFGMKYLDAAFQNPATTFIISPNVKLDFWNGGFNGSLYLMPGTVINMFTGQPLSIASGATLTGTSTLINGDLVIGAGATITPAGASTTAPIGGLIVSSHLTLGGTTLMRLNGTGVNDTITATNGIVYGGALTLVNLSGTPLVAGNSFQLFNSTSYSGTFTSTSLPALNSGLVWDLSQLSTSGTISVVVAGASKPVVSSTTISGGNFIFSGTNGTAGGNYVVLTATNLTAPLANWIPTQTNAFDINGAFHVTNAVTPGSVPHFFFIKLQ